MDVLTEEAVNRFTLFIFAETGHIKALSWSSARCLTECFEPLPGAAAQQLRWQSRSLVHGARHWLRSVIERCPHRLRHPSSSFLLLNIPHRCGSAVFSRSADFWSCLFESWILTSWCPSVPSWSLSLLLLPTVLLNATRGAAASCSWLWLCC